MSRRQPEGPPPAPVAQRIRIRYAKRGRMRFCSHRDFARAFERALRRAEIPMAYSAGFHPHPKISYVGAAPTGVASEAEYLEIGLTSRRDPEVLGRDIDAVLPEGLDIVAAVDASDCPTGGLAESIVASHWRLEFAEPVVALKATVEVFMARESISVERLTKDGRRQLEARAPVLTAWVDDVTRGDEGTESSRAILDLVVRQVTPSVRPDDVLTALTSVTGFAPSRAPLATRVAQGPIEADGTVGDPLSAAPVAEAAREQPSAGTR
jgi:radical SAM-linked protein